ncbi:MAG: ferritin [Verrucomicrobiae bacterium]|nr:ferritin [Verrucomicrobiae bacterium]
MPEQQNKPSRKIQDAINEQIAYEFYSAYIYLSMSAHFEAQNLRGFAAWMRTKFAEEQQHALKLFDYLHDRGARANLQPIPAPPQQWNNCLEVFVGALKHEQGVTARIHKLYELALSEKDYATQAMLQWFITEQVEEEKTVGEIVEQLKLIDAKGTAILMLDHKLGEAAKAG